MVTSSPNQQQSVKSLEIHLQDLYFLVSLFLQSHNLCAIGSFMNFLIPENSKCLIAFQRLVCFSIVVKKAWVAVVFDDVITLAHMMTRAQVCC